MLGRRENNLFKENGRGDNDLITLAKKSVSAYCTFLGERPEDLNLGQIWKLGSKQSKKQRPISSRMKVENDIVICICLRDMLEMVLRSYGSYIPHSSSSVSMPVHV